jgi:hypothetical protein
MIPTGIPYVSFQGVATHVDTKRVQDFYMEPGHDLAVSGDSKKKTVVSM